MAYLKKYVRLQKSHRRKVDKEREDIVGALASNAKLPDTLDWRTDGFTPPPANQKSCGSCYAFSIAHSIMGQIYKRTGNLIPLSAQQIVDCSVILGNHGCAGGSLRTTLRYLEKSAGLMREYDYPYKASVKII